MNRADVECGISSVAKKTEKIKVLKLQINFRRKILNQSHPDSSVFKFSQNRKQYSIDRLKHNLFRLLIEENPPDEDDIPVPSPENILAEPELLVGQRIRHQFKVNGKLSWYEGTVLKRNAVTNEFEVIYDGEDDTYWFPLLEDISTGDLLVCSV